MGLHFDWKGLSQWLNSVRINVTRINKQSQLDKHVWQIYKTCSSLVFLKALNLSKSHIYTTLHLVLTFLLYRLSLLIISTSGWCLTININAVSLGGTFSPHLIPRRSQLLARSGSHVVWIVSSVNDINLRIWNIVLKILWQYAPPDTGRKC